jgi:thiamine transport system permease protein
VNEAKARMGQGETDWRRSLLDVFSRRGVRGTGYGLVVVFFIFLVLLPTLFVLSYLFTGWNDIQTVVLADRAKMSMIWNAIGLSFGVAFFVTFLDLIFGLPLAWFIVRRKFRGKSLLNTIIDSPLAVPTAGLGISVVLFWGAIPDLANRPVGAWSLFGGTSSPFWILVLLHLTTTFPYMVRSLSAILDEIDLEYETAARIGGASKLTAARTITMPMFRSGLATGAILCLAKALSETGGVMAALTLISPGGLSESSGLNGTALIGVWKGAYDAGGSGSSQLLPALTFVSVLMILFSLLLLVIVKVLTLKFHIPWKKVWPSAEARLSKGIAPRLRDGATFFFLAMMVLVPSFFIAAYMATSSPTQGVDWGMFTNGLLLSFGIASAATAVDLLLGIPLAVLIARGKFRRLGNVLDTLVNIPYIVPSAALGLSLGFFYRNMGIRGFDILLVTLAHVAFTFPFVVRNVVGGLEGLDRGYEDTARTLGARPFQAFRKIIYPLIKPSILAGAIMAFTRSIGETGATISVSSDVPTAPVLIVNYTKQDPSTHRPKDLYTAGLLIAVLSIVTFAAILLMRFVTHRRRKNA